VSEIARKIKRRYFHTFSLRSAPNTLGSDRTQRHAHPPPEGVTTPTSPTPENEREFARKYVVLRHKIDLHGCEDPPHCPECSPLLYQIGVTAIRLGIITPRLPADRFDNLPDEVTAEQIEAAYQHDPRDE
jgi:hypothetical protein